MTRMLLRSAQIRQACLCADDTGASHYSLSPIPYSLLPVPPVPPPYTHPTPYGGCR